MMSVRLGVYDLFANIIPGFLYLYVVDAFARLLGVIFIAFAEPIDLTRIAALALAAFILGHIFNSLTYDLWYRIFIRKHDGEVSLERLRKQYPLARFNFGHNDEVLILSILYRENDKLLEKIESLHVSALLLRNISFGLFLLALAETLTYFLNGSPSFLYIAFACLVFSGLALRQARVFYRWFYRNVFLGGLNHIESIIQAIGARKTGGKK
jgi:hypothetical protein